MTGKCHPESSNNCLVLCPDRMHQRMVCFYVFSTLRYNSRMKKQEAYRESLRVTNTQTEVNATNICHPEFSALNRAYHFGAECIKGWNIRTTFMKTSPCDTTPGKEKQVKVPGATQGDNMEYI